MSAPKKHHIIPQMLLKNFAYENKLCVYNKELKSYRTDQDIKNVCVQNYYYGNDSSLEEFLAKEVESTSAHSLEKFKVNPEIISSQDKVNIAIFLTFMFLRTERGRNICAEIVRNHLEGEIINFISDPQNIKSEEEKEYAEYIKKNGFSDFTCTIPKELIITKTFDPNVLTAVYSSIYKMNWILLEAPNDYSFILGDNPILLLVPKETLMGFNNQDLILALPLSSKLLLMADYKSKETKKAMMHPKYIEYLNAQSIIHSSQEVYFNVTQYNMIQHLIRECGENKIVFDYGDLVNPSTVKVERKK
jgi:hypothetical protein